MPIDVKIGEAKTHLSKLLAQVEAGEEVIIHRGPEPIAKLSRMRSANEVERAIAAIRAGRARFTLAVSVDDILAWKR
jgi:antitoxin (DNA-binding transcriptional repressor) of toxin-antitoxin stability system